MGIALKGRNLFLIETSRRFDGDIFKFGLAAARF